MNQLYKKFRVLLAPVICGISFAIALGIAELVVRQLYPEYVAARSDTSFWHYHPRLGWAHRPAERGKMLFATRKGDWKTVPVEINSRGFRDSERALTKPEGVYRVAVLGDSFVFGFGVYPEEVFTSLVDRNSSALEMINFGVSGYSNDQQLLVFEEQALKFSPDAAIMTLVSNDYLANIKVNSHGYPKPRFVKREGRLELINVPVPETLDTLSLYTVDRFFRHHSALYLFVTYRLQIRQLLGRLHRRFLSSEIKNEAVLSKEDFEAEVWDGVAFTKDLIEAFLNLCRQHSVLPLLLMVPSTPDHINLTAHQQALASFCENHPPCRVLNPYPAFRSAKVAPEALYQADRNHWSAKGHAIVAAEIRKELELLAQARD